MLPPPPPNQQKKEKIKERVMMKLHTKLNKVQPGHYMLHGGSHSLEIIKQDNHWRSYITSPAWHDNNLLTGIHDTLTEARKDIPVIVKYFHQYFQGMSR